MYGIVVFSPTMGIQITSDGQFVDRDLLADACRIAGRHINDKLLKDACCGEQGPLAGLGKISYGTYLELTGLAATQGADV